MQNDPQVGLGARSRMDKASWVEVWHMIVAIVARQPPFLAIAIVTGAVFVAVMALEGCRTSFVAIRRAHRKTAPNIDAPVTLAAPAPLPAAPTRSFSTRSVPGAAATMARKRKPLTVAVRNFRSPRPTIRRHPSLEFAAESAMPHFAPDTAALQQEGV